MRSIYFTLCQVLRRDVVERVNFLHDQLLLVDLDHERSIPFVPSKPELADRVLEFLWDVYGVGLVGCVRKKKSTTAEKYKSGRRTNRTMFSWRREEVI